MSGFSDMVGVPVVCGMTFVLLLNVAALKNQLTRCEDRIEETDRWMALVHRQLERMSRPVSAEDWIKSISVPETAMPTNIIPVEAVRPVAIPVDEEIRRWYESLATNPASLPPPRVQEILRNNLAESVREYWRLLKATNDEYVDGATNISPYAFVLDEEAYRKAAEFYEAKCREGEGR